MNFWSKDIVGDAEEGRAKAMMPKKRRKQAAGARGLSAVSIGRRSARSVHQRNEDRHVLSGTNAQARMGDAVHEVQILNLSSNGVMIAYSGDLTIGQRISIAIEDCAPINAAVRWLRQGRVGLEFVAETVIIAEAGVQDFIIDTIAKERAAAQYKPGAMIAAEQRNVDLRHELVWLGRLRWDGQDITARLRNISATGAMLSVSADTNLANGDAVTLSLETIGRAKAKVRWVSGRQIGIEFDESFDVSRLVHEACAQLAPSDEAGAILGPRQSSDHDDTNDEMTIRLGMVENPHHPPEMKYGKLTLDEVYDTLYPQGRPVGHDKTQSDTD